MNILNNKYILIIIVLSVVFSSCKTGGLLVIKERKKGQIKNITDAKLIKNVEHNNLEFNTLFFKKFQAEVDINGQNKTFKGNLFIRKDTSIIVSILPLMGIELFRIKFEPDSIYILDRTKKKILVADYDLLWKKFYVDIDFYAVQNMLLNQFFCYPSSEIDKSCIKKFKHYVRKDQYVLQSIKNGRYTRISKKNNFKDIIYQEFTIAPDIFKISKCYINDFGSNSRFVVDYKDFIELEDNVFPSVFKISGERSGSKFYMNIEFKNIELDGISKISFKHSDKYTIEQIK